MTLMLRDIWPIADPDNYKVHFARWNKVDQPLEVWARNRDDYQSWQEYRPRYDEFNRPYIFSLAQFYHETDIWLFTGVFRVVTRHQDQYVVELIDAGQAFIGRLKIRSPYRGRSTRVNFENHLSDLEIQEILREPYSGRAFPGYDGVHLSFDELEALVRNDRPDWKASLGSVSGIYLITDVNTGKRYVGSAYGDHGIWSRWASYVETGHGGNVELRNLVKDPTLEYCRANFRFALLEQCPLRMSADEIIGRETHWKEILLTRGEHGLNRN